MANNVTYKTFGSASGTGVESLDVSITCGTYTSGLMVAGVAIRGGVAVTGITWGEQNFTKRIDQQPASDNRIELWTLASPNAGTGNVTITLDSAQSISAAVVIYEYVSAINDIQEAGSADATTSSLVTVTSDTNEKVVDVVGLQAANSSLTVGTGQTQRVKQVGGHNVVGISEEEGAASVDMTWTFNSDYWAAGAIGLEEATTTSTSTSTSTTSTSTSTTSTSSSTSTTSSSSSSTSTTSTSSSSSTSTTTFPFKPDRLNIVKENISIGEVSLF
jgi:hypothetical protein